MKTLHQCDQGNDVRSQKHGCAVCVCNAWITVSLNTQEMHLKVVPFSPALTSATGALSKASAHCKSYQ